MCLCAADVIVNVKMCVDCVCVCVGHLWLSRVTASDAGVYVCEARDNDQHTTLLTAQSTLHVVSM